MNKEDKILNTNEDKKLFVDTILDPPKANDKLTQASKNHEKLIKENNINLNTNTMSLQLQQLQLKKNTLLIDEHPVQVSEYIGTIKRSDENIRNEKLSRYFRTGVVKAEGEQDSKRIQMYFKGDTMPTTLVGQTVLYMANSVNPVDIKIEDMNAPMIINTDYLIALIDESASTPY